MKPMLPQQLVTQQGQTRKVVLIKLCAFVSGTCVTFNNIQSIFKVVIIHGRGDFIISQESQIKELKDKLAKIKELIDDEFDYTAFALNTRIKKILEEKQK